MPTERTSVTPNNNNNNNKHSKISNDTQPKKIPHGKKQEKEEKEKDKKKGHKEPTKSLCPARHCRPRPPRKNFTLGTYQLKRTIIHKLIFRGA